LHIVKKQQIGVYPPTPPSNVSRPSPVFMLFWRWRSKNDNKNERNEEESNISSSSAFHRPTSPSLIRHPISTESSTHFSITSPTLSSAFKKVDQKKNNIIGNPYDFSSLYQRVAASSMLPATNNSSQLIPQLTLANPLHSTLTTTNTKSLISNALLPYLPPSLTALTFPATNWCAKCNATFRMTSDLVYHMRSHHKNVTNLDPLKKRKEKKN